MKIKVSEASGPVLDWMVAYASGAMTNDPELRTAANFLEHQERYPKHCYQRYWAQGGPIIERVKISVQCFDQSGPTNQAWNAYVNGPPLRREDEINGPTPLIAAMRCFVTSRLGEEVDVPDELT